LGKVNIESQKQAKSLKLEELIESSE